MIPDGPRSQLATPTVGTSGSSRPADAESLGTRIGSTQSRVHGPARSIAIAVVSSFSCVSPLPAPQGFNRSLQSSVKAVPWAVRRRSSKAESSTTTRPFRAQQQAAQWRLGRLREASVRRPRAWARRLRRLHASHRIAISNQRILSVEQGRIAFRHRDSVDTRRTENVNDS